MWSIKLEFSLCWENPLIILLQNNDFNKWAHTLSVINGNILEIRRSLSLCDSNSVSLRIELLQDLSSSNDAVFISLLANRSPATNGHSRGVCTCNVQSYFVLAVFICTNL